MAKYGTRSKKNLSECHIDLQKIWEFVIKHFDNSVIKGHRNEEEQNEAFDNGFSKLKYPYSKHNKQPSMALDSIPYPIDWNDTDRMYYFAGHVVSIAEIMYSRGEISHKIRFGGDWDGDKEVKDQRFMDLVHFELVN